MGMLFDFGALSEYKNEVGVQLFLFVIVESTCSSVGALG